jgi:signal transduction histidine kinase
MRLLHLIAALAGLISAVGWNARCAESLESSQVTLTNAAQIRHLSAEEAARSIPVHLKGAVVTEAGPSINRAAVIWDQTAGIYLLGTTNEFVGVQRGDFIEVVGVTDPGEFAPIVKISSVKRLGSGGVPDATPVTFEELLSGGLDAQWVEITGVVHTLDATVPRGGFGGWHMDVAMGGGKISVVSNGPRPENVAPDALVRVQAACFYQFTQRRQVVRPQLFVPARVTVDVVEAAPAGAESARIRPVGGLLEFSPEMAVGHRVHVGGVVTHQEPGATVWIRDDSGALRIQTSQAEQLQPGDRIEVLGFPKYGSYTPALEDAVFEKRASGDPPPAVSLGTPALAFDHQADLVSLDATLTEVEPVSDGWLLTLQETNMPFKALLKKGGNASFAREWQAGSVVRVTGICAFIADDAGPVLSGVWHPQSFQILLRSPDDLVTLKPPPWWTPRHIIVLLLLVTGGSVAISALVMSVARHRLREQARRRAMAEAEFAAILSERNRVAREIHDTLAQGLAATSVHLRLANKSANGAPEPVAHHLEVAQQLVKESLEEARNSIWNMRSQVLETADLAGALKGILHQMADGTELKCHFQTSGEPRRLAPFIENNILRVGQEAISNAVHHAAARSISVDIGFAEKGFSLEVTDDGRGFDAATPPSGRGGFGLVGMRERAAELNGQLALHSVPGEGTSVHLAVPLPAAE